MDVKQMLVEFLVVFLLAFVTTVLVSFLYTLIAHGAGVINWELSVRNGLLLGIVFPLSGLLMKRRNQD